MSGPGRVSRFGVPDLGIGVGFRVPHFRRVVEERPPMDWFEVLSENFMVDGGSPRRHLEQLLEGYRAVPHGVSLSLGSVEDRGYLDRLERLVRLIDPPWASDHVCFTGTPHLRVHDLLPVPYTRAMLRHMADRVKAVQDRLQIPFAVENPSSYLTYRDSDLAEWDFVAELAERADCALLLDVNNVYVSACNHGFDPVRYLDAMPVDRVVQIHLAGHSRQGSIRIDTHDHPVCDEVWALYRHAVHRIGSVSTLVEWDGHIPTWERLVEEAERARSHRDAALREGSGLAAGPSTVHPGEDRLPEDWQDRMVAMIARQAPADGAWFRGGPELSPQGQIEVYQVQYDLRLMEALETEAPGLVRLLGTAEARALLRRYLDANPSRSWTLDHVARALPAWLAADGQPGPVVAMARLEDAVQRGFSAAAGAPLRPEGLPTAPALRLAPPVGLVRLDWDVHRYRSESLQGVKDPAPPVPGDFCVVVFRAPTLRMRHLEVEPGAFGTLLALAEGRPLGEALAEGCAGLPGEGLAERVGGWFRTFGELGLLEADLSPAGA